MKSAHSQCRYKKKGTGGRNINVFSYLEDKFLNSVKKIIFEVAEGDLILSIRFDVFNGDDIPSDHSLNGFAKRIVDWVFDDINIF